MKGSYTLMHKNDKVATCVFDAMGYLKSVPTIYNKHLLPLCIGDANPMLDLRRWILSRTLATNRKDVASLREFYGSSAFQTSLGTSLFDCYWFANNNHKDWEQENAYDNWDYKKDTLYLMLTNPEALTEIDTNSPNLTIPGRSQRLWYKENNQFYLLHGDAQKEMTDYKKNKDNVILNPRDYFILKGTIYAKTKSETNKEIERYSFEDIYNLCQQSDKTKIQNLQICCEKFGIPEWKNFIYSMCEFDERTENTTRELSEIGVLRNSTTLETIGFAKL